VARNSPSKVPVNALLAENSPVRVPVILPLNGPVPMSAVKPLPGSTGWVAIARGPIPAEAVGAPTSSEMFQAGASGVAVAGAVTK
jgi:hypothetical protein